MARPLNRLLLLALERGMLLMNEYVVVNFLRLSGEDRHHSLLLCKSGAGDFQITKNVGFGDAISPSNFQVLNFPVFK